MTHKTSIPCGMCNKEIHVPKDKNYGFCSWCNLVTLTEECEGECECGMKKTKKNE